MEKSITTSAWCCYVLLAALIQIHGGASSEQKLAADGTVLELNDSNFDSAISSFDYVLADFYAPWCGHCKRLSPQLDLAAPALAALKVPVVIVKVDADKYTRLAKKYEIDGYPTLKLFIHGVPLDYNGPRKAELLVRYLKKFVAPDVSVLDSDSAVRSFVEEAGTYFPIFVGFGLSESLISNLAAKYKKKAWFSVAKDFSEDAMVLYDFDKAPALLVLHPGYKEQHIFYGPFEEEFLEGFIKQNLFPHALPITYESLKSLEDDDRKIVVTVMEDEEHESSKKLVNILKSAASANPDLVFGYVGVKQWESFAKTFGVTKKDKLPKMVVWNRDEDYLTVIGSESMDEEDQATQVSRFLEGFREGRTIKTRMAGPSFLGYINSLIGVRSIFLVVFVIAVITLIQTIRGDDEPDEAGARDRPVQSGSSVTGEVGSGLKED